MLYSSIFLLLDRIFNIAHENIPVPELGIEINNLPFESHSRIFLPGASSYHCLKHNTEFTEKDICCGHPLFDEYPEFLKHHDTDIRENCTFNYPVFRKSGGSREHGVILLLHGLNEKYWNKYLPWAYMLNRLTGKAVILFPIAFHMNRSPAEWSETRTMGRVAELRKKNSAGITNSTFANAAISTRIEMIPQRFFWSGLQTFYDVVTLINSIKKGKHPFIDPQAQVDLFSYSIGSFLSEILMMSNPRGYFTNSKLFMFCGGCTLDRMSPNSKFILDSDATIALYSFYTEKLESALRDDKRIAHYFNGAHDSGSFFRSMLSYRKHKELREKRFRELSGQVYAVALKKDEVIAPAEVVNTLQGDYRDVPVKVDILDFEYPYSHIKPFPEEKNYSQQVDAEFNRIFTAAAQFFCR